MKITAQDLLQLGGFAATLLVALLEVEHRQRHPDADENYADLREGVAVVFQQFFPVGKVGAHIVRDMRIDHQRQDDEEQADENKPGDEHISRIAEDEVHGAVPPTWPNRT